jgi:hypothetical protein
MEGALDDMSFLEVQTMQQNFALLAPGTKASTKAKERYFQKVQPDLELSEEDFVSPTVPTQEEGEAGAGNAGFAPENQQPLSQGLQSAAAGI